MKIKTVLMTSQKGCWKIFVSWKKNFTAVEQKKINSN